MGALFSGTSIPDLTKVRDFPALTEHYCLWTDKGAWDSGTLFLDKTKDGSIFRIGGTAYANSGALAWSSMPWIPGTNNKSAGWKTFKVKTPSKAKVCRVGLQTIVSTALVGGNLNTSKIIIGTDGYVYVACFETQPPAADLNVAFFGAIMCVDDLADYDTYISGAGA